MTRGFLAGRQTAHHGESVTHRLPLSAASFVLSKAANFKTKVAWLAVN